MILLLIALIFLTVFGRLALDRAGYDDFLQALTGLIATITGLCGLVIYAVLIFMWVAAGHKADLINREFQTNYTQAEIFYASDVIDAIAQIKRTRIELNGNLFEEQE